MKNQKPVLIPAAVPWAIATSAPHLKLRQNADGRPSDLTFIGYFKLNESAQTPDNAGIQIVRDPGDFRPEIYAENAPYRMVRVSLDGGFAYRKNHAVSDHEVIPEDNFDWHAVPGSLRADENALENMLRTDSYWRKTGHSPDPGFYEVLDSPWIANMTTHDSNLHHYIIAGEDEYFDIAARSWRWEAGQRA